MSGVNGTGCHLVAFLLLTSCARVQAPPGGPTDQVPPVLVSTYPESLAVLPNFKGEVEFRFDEVVAEGSTPNFGLGTGDLERLVILSPTLAVPSVRWRRSRITVEPREGWRPNTVYRVELLPGIVDLSNNRGKLGSVVTFSTGAPLPTTTLRGMVVDWTTQRPSPRGLVEAILLPDSLPYRTRADSAGNFALGPIPAGEYLVYGVIDQNNDVRFDRREPYHAERLPAGRETVGEMWAFRHDTTFAGRVAVTVNDSVSLLLSFAQQLNPFQRIAPDSVELRLLPDSVLVPVLKVLPKEEYDSFYRVRVAVDTTAAGRARADSIRADSLRRTRADSVRADSLQRARELLQIRIPGAGRRQQAAADTAGKGPLRTKPPLFDKLYVRVGERLRPGATYAVAVKGLENLSRITGTALGVVKVPDQKPPADSLKAKPDTPSVTLRNRTPR